MNTAEAKANVFKWGMLAIIALAIGCVSYELQKALYGPSPELIEEVKGHGRQIDALTKAVKELKEGN